MKKTLFLSGSIDLELIHLNDLLINSSLQTENQEQISLIDEVDAENQERIKLELSKTFENIEETNGN